MAINNWLLTGLLAFLPCLTSCWTVLDNLSATRTSWNSVWVSTLILSLFKHYLAGWLDKQCSFSLEQSSSTLKHFLNVGRPASSSSHIDRSFALMRQYRTENIDNQLETSNCHNSIVYLLYRRHAVVQFANSFLFSSAVVRWLLLQCRLQRTDYTSSNAQHCTGFTTNDHFVPLHSRDSCGYSNYALPPSRLPLTQGYHRPPIKN